MPHLVIVGSIALAALVGLAFWPGYFSRSFSTIDSYTHVHAVVAALWLALLIAQPSLILARRLDWHRRLGRVSWVLGPLFVLSSILLAHVRFASMDRATFTREAYTLYLPLSAALLFSVAFALAMANRRNLRLHSRFIACTALLLVDPVCARVLAFHVVELPQFWHYQLLTFSLEAAVLLLMTLTLAPRSASRRAFSAFASFYAAVLLVWFIGARTAPWLAFADWFRRQPIT